jgi:hypothetical protein
LNDSGQFAKILANPAGTIKADRLQGETGDARTKTNAA